jgi:hypothetical protein
MSFGALHAHHTAMGGWRGRRERERAPGAIRPIAPGNDLSLGRSAGRRTVGEATRAWPLRVATCRS